MQINSNTKLTIQLVAFFLLAFVLAWAAWIPSFLHPKSFKLLSFVGLFAPAIAALVVTFYVDKSRGVKDLIARFKLIRFGISYYLISIFLVPFLFTLSIWIDGFLFHTSFKNILLPSPTYFIVAAFAWLMFINSGEEIGWRGYALPHLQKIFKNPLLATFILGILWSAWHLPLYLVQGQSSFPLSLFFLFTTGICFIYTFVFNSTNGSLFFVLVLHASTDIVPRVLNITLFKPTTWLVLGVITWLTVIILFKANKKIPRHYPQRKT